MLFNRVTTLMSSSSRSHFVDIVHIQEFDVCNPTSWGKSSSVIKSHASNIINGKKNTKKQQGRSRRSRKLRKVHERIDYSALDAEPVHADAACMQRPGTWDNERNIQPQLYVHVLHSNAGASSFLNTCMQDACEPRFSMIETSSDMA